MSFPLEASFEGEEVGLGDLVLAPWTIERQALAGGREPSEEMERVIVHGILHMLGYDHVGAARERARMRAREEEVLGALRARLGGNPS